MFVKLFVYGTLKQGFPNHAVNTGRRLPGVFKTRARYPLWVVRLAHEDRAPWLMGQPGQGFQVLGEVYEVPADALPQIDQLEEVGRPTGHARTEIELEDGCQAGAVLQAQAYLKPADHLQQCLAREGPFPEYTRQLAQGYWLKA